MPGAYYIWIMLAFFTGCFGVIFLLVGLFWIGHWLEKKETGARHGFLELPHEQRSRPAGSQSQRPEASIPPTPPDTSEPPAPPEPPTQGNS